MLIERHKHKGLSIAEGGVYPSPVVGAEVDDTTPTSADVHLYADPQTFHERMPMLYADCEGFNGGEQVPKSAQSRKRTGSFSGQTKLKKPSSKGAIKGRQRPIAWANDDEKRRREFFVTELYPRVLYTFSDVVVFVLRTAK